MISVVIAVALAGTVRGQPPRRDRLSGGVVGARVFGGPHAVLSQATTSCSCFGSGCRDVAWVTSRDVGVVIEELHDRFRIHRVVEN